MIMVERNDIQGQNGVDKKMDPVRDSIIEFFPSLSDPSKKAELMEEARLQNNAKKGPGYGAAKTLQRGAYEATRMGRMTMQSDLNSSKIFDEKERRDELARAKTEGSYIKKNKDRQRKTIDKEADARRCAIGLPGAVETVESEADGPDF